MSQTHNKFLQALRGLESKKTPIENDEMSANTNPDLEISEKVFDSNREETEEDGIRQGQLRMMKVRWQVEQARKCQIKQIPGCF
jgi:hypothetical protein|tara:strand:- start:986 stop:1237 length:252 start_codon:yes stop_codon:yes gene_type:complete